MGRMGTKTCHASRLARKETITGNRLETKRVQNKFYQHDGTCPIQWSPKLNFSRNV
jgi:hypothetical protein